MCVVHSRRPMHRTSVAIFVPVRSPCRAMRPVDCFRIHHVCFALELESVCVDSDGDSRLLLAQNMTSELQRSSGVQDITNSSGGLSALLQFSRIPVLSLVPVTVLFLN